LLGEAASTGLFAIVPYVTIKPRIVGAVLISRVSSPLATERRMRRNKIRLPCLLAAASGAGPGGAAGDQCKPEGTEISIRESADLCVKYVNQHPEMLHAPAEHAVILAIAVPIPAPADPG
jgi:hypothetical protein